MKDEILPGILLSELVEAATEVLNENGDMRVFLDHFDSEHQYAVVEVRREVSKDSSVVNFTLADYYYEEPALRLVK